MSKKNFIVTSDSCADLFKSDYEKMQVPLIVVKRVLNGEEHSDVYDSEAELDTFYESLKTERPSTVAVNTQEFVEFFTKVLSETEGDIIHICLSSGLSLTYDNAIKALPELEKIAKGRKIHIIDSLLATYGEAILVEALVEMRDAGFSTEDALAKAIHLRDHTQGWVVVSDLYHLKRGGRISGAKAAIGTILGIKPVICASKYGKLAIENKAKGTKKAVSYLMEKLEELGDMANPDFLDSSMYILRTTKTDTYDELKKEIQSKYPSVTLKEGIIGPVIGTHVGGEAVAIIFVGAPKLDIQ